jgi:hypothetical protein
MNLSIMPGVLPVSGLRQAHALRRPRWKECPMWVELAALTMVFGVFVVRLARAIGRRQK